MLYGLQDVLLIIIESSGYKMNLYQKLEKGIYIIAEMSANHAGSIERAKEIIHTAKDCGADCVKIQTYTPDTLTIDCDNNYFKIESGTWKGENLYSLYGKAYTPWEWQTELSEEAKKAEIDFLSTPFDSTSVDFLENMGMTFYKIASFELIDIPLIKYVAATGKPIILSTGMGTLEEIEEAVATIKAVSNSQIVLLKCSSAYPAPIESMNIRTISDMKERFGVPIGLSDHSMGSLGAISAVSLGARVIEKHFCLSRDIKNPDSSFSMEPKEFKQMVTDLRQVEKALGSVNYEMTEDEKSNICFRRSVFVVKDMIKGEVFSKENTRVIRPGYGMKPKFYEEILGKHAGKNICCGTPLTFDMIKEQK